MTSAIAYRCSFCKGLNNYFQVLKRISSSRAPDVVFVEKSLEEPVLVVSEEDNVDMVGPPHPVSNLRPILRRRLLNETALQQRLREMQDSTQEWNQQFWVEHNNQFIKEKEEFVASHQIPGEEKRLPNADEMSEFYKTFLDKNWERHVRYNMEWYRKNFTMLFLALRVSLEKSFAKVL